MEPSSMVSVLPPKEELPTCFEVKARILDFYPITLDEENCLLRVCGDCKNLSVPCDVLSRSFALNTSSKDCKNRGNVSQLFEPDASSACVFPLLAFVHVGHRKWRRARGNSWKYRCRSQFDDHPRKNAILIAHSNRMD